MNASRVAIHHAEIIELDNLEFGNKTATTRLIRDLHARVRAMRFKGCPPVQLIIEQLNGWAGILELCKSRQIGIVSRGRDVQEEGGGEVAGERTASGQQEEQDAAEKKEEKKKKKTTSGRKKRKKRKRGTKSRSQEPRDEGATRAYISKEKEHAEKETRPIVIAIPKGRMFLRRCVPSHADPQANPNDSHPTGGKQRNSVRGKGKICMAGNANKTESQGTERGTDEDRANPGNWNERTRRLMLFTWPTHRPSLPAQQLAVQGQAKEEELVCTLHLITLEAPDSERRSLLRSDGTGGIEVQLHGCSVVARGR
ncbi:hypothetical protein WN48_06124 [Eufriesea mexicana]|nr:hypothetical protein WN48_06124 [Eufriesea mexicana]